MIKRYNHSMKWDEPSDEDFAVTEPCPDGQWVRYADHQQAVAQARSALQAVQDSLSGQPLTASALAALELCREALAALTPTDSGK